jgi:hypothetical protein
MNVIEFPSKAIEPEFLVGPFEEYRVQVSGRFIPKLSGYAHVEGTYGLTVDNRFGGTFSSKQDAQQAAWLIAQALAIGQGYSNLEAPNKDQPFAPKACCVGNVSTEANQ